MERHMESNRERQWRLCTILLFVCLPTLAISCGGSRVRQVNIEGKNIRVEVNQLMHTRLVAKMDGKEIVLGEFVPSESITAAGKDIADFALISNGQEEISDRLGVGRRFILAGKARSLEKRLEATVYEEFPHMVFIEVFYTNTGNSDLSMDGWTNHHYVILAPPGSGEPAFWSYQSGSYEKRPDWVLPLRAGFNQENYLGMNASDYGGGTPVLDVWRRDVGVGVGHVELSPKLISLPVTMPGGDRATLAVRLKKSRLLKPGETLKTFRTFVAVHHGDYYQTLREYRRVMVRQGVEFQPAPACAFAPIWCAWGFGRDFVPSQLYNALPIVKKLGFTWVTLDDGWQTAEGDWFLNKKKYPNGDRDIQALVGRIHSEGFKAQLWWAPLSVDPGTELIKKHPEQLLLNADGSKQKISWWDAWYLCPALPEVVEYHQALVVKVMKEWGFDGLKLDGQHMNGVPPCYNAAHHHAVPEASVEALPAFFKAIHDTARSIKPDALVEFCPCGTAYSFFTLPFMDMSVASDPGSSWQIRSKGKTLKALHGDSTAYFGDHVELSDGGDDFASTVGIGGVVGSNFTWPVGSAKKQKLDLTPLREKLWEKWIRIYKDKMLSRGEYLGGIYDLGFDKPEAHAIRKDGKMYYAFYAPQWKGRLELRGLDKRSYRVTDYVNKKDLGRVNGPLAALDVEFQQHLLLEARPD